MIIFYQVLRKVERFYSWRSMHSTAPQLVFGKIGRDLYIEAVCRAIDPGS